MSSFSCPTTDVRSNVSYGHQCEKVSTAPILRHENFTFLIGGIRWDEKAGLRRDAMIGHPAPLGREFEVVIMIAVVIEEMVGSD